MSADKLFDFHFQFQDLFKRCEQRDRSLRYPPGQLSTLERRMIEPMVLAQTDADPNAMELPRISGSSANFVLNYGG
jgi:hypothetical protein